MALVFSKSQRDVGNIVAVHLSPVPESDKYHSRQMRLREGSMAGERVWSLEVMLKVKKPQLGSYSIIRKTFLQCKPGVKYIAVQEVAIQQRSWSKLPYQHDEIYLQMYCNVYALLSIVYF